MLIFQRFAPLDKREFSYRDDAVITLSHAKNLIEYGAIGIDAAGARVEGFSTPLQFWIFALAYGLTRCGYQVFLDVQVTVCSFLLGCGFVYLFRPHWRRGCVLSIGLAFWLTTNLRFFGWHHSGMENAYAHVLLVALLGLCQYSLERRVIGYPLLICAWLASLTRLESIVHVAPLLCIWSFAYARKHRSFEAWRGNACVLLAWCAYQAFRLAYFGSLQPNTAIAEGIDVVAMLRELVSHGALTPERDKALLAMRQIAGEHRAYLALASIPLLTLGRRHCERSLLVWMLVSLGVTGLAHPLLFGPARLDPVRTVSQVALVAPLLIATQWAELPRWPARIWTGIALAVLLTFYVRLEPPSDRFFCCPLPRADRIADTCLAHAKREELAGPSLANPDLGRISFRKDFLLFDLGLLGTPPLALLRRESQHTADYLLDFAQPDFIELHGGWVCEYGYLFGDARFRERYAPLPAGRKLGLSTSCKGGSGIWFRKAMAKGSATVERQLHDALHTRLEPARIASELRSCERQSDRLACVYVARTVYRFIPELVRRGDYARTLALFQGSKSHDYDLNLLGARTKGTWYKPLVRFVRAPAITARTDSSP